MYTNFYAHVTVRAGTTGNEFVQEVQLPITETQFMILNTYDMQAYDEEWENLVNRIPNFVYNLPDDWYIDDMYVTRS